MKLREEGEGLWRGGSLMFTLGRLGRCAEDARSMAFEILKKKSLASSG